MNRINHVVKRMVGKLIRRAPIGEKAFMDVLFINGCYLPHPSRYRCEHQIEQLFAAGLVCEQVFYTDIDMDSVRRYRAFVLFRCPYTEQIGEFIRLAKSLNKLVVFDIDDLVFDVSYTKSIKYIETMNDEEKKIYYDGIENIQKTLKLCDIAITTTERMADELGRFINRVFINRNVASEKMVQLSEKAISQKKYDDNKVIMGYFSGSITHNQDFNIIMPAIIELMDTNDSLYLSIVGELDIPDALKGYSDRIIVNKFVDWEELPGLVASVDINLAPLDDSIFNEAKSENKWVEAGLVKVPTVASNIGAFKKMIQDGITGVLCGDINDWKSKLQALINDVEYRKKIGKNAYEFVKENCITIHTAYNIENILTSNFITNFMFVIPVFQISGGALVAIKHCTILKKHGYDVTIFNEGDEPDKWVEKDGESIPIFNIKNSAFLGSIDNAVGTLWTTMDFIRQYPRIENRFYLVQNYETDFYSEETFLKFRANQSYFINEKVRYLTISRWCQKWLEEKYHKASAYAPNGIDCEVFYPKVRFLEPKKIRILIEGNSDDYYKNVDESFKIVELLDKSRYEIYYLSYQGKPKGFYYVDKFMHKVPYEKVADVYRSCDILIKSSILESFSYPPLEMMATGGFVVVAPNGGNIEYLEDGENCLFYDHDYLESAVRAIEKICDDERLREKLYQNGINTARKRDWQSIEREILKLYI